MSKETQVIPDNRVVYTKRLVGKKGGPKRHKKLA
jgi:hypothetical protein